MSEGATQTNAAAAAVSRRTALRLGLAALAAAIGVAYMLVALQVVHVAETAGKDSPFLPMAAAAAAFWLGAALLLLFDRRPIYLLGAAVQVVVLIGYFVVASSRDPHYEAWGVLMKVAEVVMLVLLLYLAVKTSPGSKGARAAR
jgi:hypothetical protein